MDTWCIFVKLSTIFRNLFSHTIENLDTSFGSLFNGLLGNIKRQSLNLQVELETRDTITGSSNLEVHVTKVVFRTENVGQNDVF